MIILYDTILLYYTKLYELYCTTLYCAILSCTALYYIGALRDHY